MINRVIASAAARHAGKTLRVFQESLTRCADLQESLRRRILQSNSAADFGRQHKFSALESYRDFAAALPLANYSYFRPYIERCLRGEAGALFGPDERLLMFAMTSGTTARAKYIPVTQTFADNYRRGWNVWGIKALGDHPTGYLRKILQVTSPPDDEISEGGYPCGAISGMLARNQKYIVRRMYPAPFDVARIGDPTARYYSIMRFALPYREIGFISTANPSTTVTLARTAATQAEQLIRDLHDGTLTPPGPMDDQLAQRLGRKLRRHRRRARELQQLLDRHGKLLPRDYWDVAFLANWTGGSTALYLPALKEMFGDVPIRDIGLLASEARCSIPFSDETAAGVLDITANVYEFVPADEIDAAGAADQGDTLDGSFTVLRPHELEVNGCYYIFLTTPGGLYRYNIGDLVRCTGFVGNTPLIEFLSKGAHTSSVTGEKLTENQVVQAVRYAATECSLDVTTFTMTPVWAERPYYRLVCESPQSLTSEHLQELGRRTDERLGQTNIEYQSKRKSERLGAIVAEQCADGALTERDRTTLSANAGRAEQFKHRFLYNRPEE